MAEPDPPTGTLLGKAGVTTPTALSTLGTTTSTSMPNSPTPFTDRFVPTTVSHTGATSLLDMTETKALLTLYPHTTHTSGPSATMSKAEATGHVAFGLGPSLVYLHEHPVRQMVAQILIVYTLLSMALLYYLLATRRLDFRGNLHIGPNNRWIGLRFGEGRGAPTTHRARAEEIELQPWRGQNNRTSRRSNNEENNAPIAHQAQGAGLQQQQQGSARNSVLTHTTIETVIDYGEPQQAEAIEEFEYYTNGPGAAFLREAREMFDRAVAGEADEEETAFLIETLGEQGYQEMILMGLAYRASRS